MRALLGSPCSMFLGGVQSHDRDCRHGPCSSAPAKWPFLRAHWWEARASGAAVRALPAGIADRAGHQSIGFRRPFQPSGAEKLRGRLAWLLLDSGRFLFSRAVAVGVRRVPPLYADALHDATMTTVTGFSIGSSHAFAQVLELIFALYSAVIIATKRGSGRSIHPCQLGDLA